MASNIRQMDGAGAIVRGPNSLPDPTKASMFSLKTWRLLFRRVNALCNMKADPQAQPGPLLISDANSILPVGVLGSNASGGTGNMRYTFEIAGSPVTAALYDATVDYDIYDVVYTNPDSNTRISWVAEIANGPHQPAGAKTPTWPEPGTVYWRALARFFFNSATPQQFRPGFSGSVNDLSIDPATGDVMAAGNFHLMDMTDDHNNVSYALRNVAAVMTTYLDPKRQHWFSALNSGNDIQAECCLFTPSGSECFVAGEGNGATNTLWNGVAVGNLTGYMAKLMNDGTVDAGFVSNSNFTPPPIGMAFDGIGGLLYVTGANVIKRLDATNGTVDTLFSFASPAASSCIIPHSGNFWIGIDASGEGLRKIDSTGATVGGFTSLGFGVGAGSTKTYGLALLPGGTNIAVVGHFDTYDTAHTPIARVNFCVLDTSGALQSHHPIISGGDVLCVYVQNDGLFFIGGDFSTVDGVSQPYLARLTSGGAIDTSWTTAPNGRVRRIVQNSRGETIIGGDFTTVGGLSRHKIARIDASGNVLGI